MSNEFNIEVKNLRNFVDAFAHRTEEFLRGMQRGMLQGAKDFEKMEVQAEMTGRPGLKRPTGNLARSFKAYEYGSGSMYTVGVGFTPNAWYWKVHGHYGGFEGTIRPKTKRFLAVPLNSSAAKRWPRAWGKDEGLYRRGHALGVNVGKRGKFKPMYALKESVYIPKRLHVLEYWKHLAPEMLAKRMHEYARRALEGKTNA